MIGPGRMLCKGGCPDDGSLQARGQAAKDAVRMGLLWGKPAFKHQGRGWAQTPDGVIFQPIWPRSPHPRTVSLQFQPAFRAGRSELSRPNILFLVWSQSPVSKVSSLSSASPARNCTARWFQHVGSVVGLLRFKSCPYHLRAVWP